jgi:RNA polymerase sigma factor (sigma-70 family)
MWSSESWSSAADAYLLARSREGSAEAFGELWRRHLPAAYSVAHRYRGRASPEDVVAEAAARVFTLVRDGRGPSDHFRAYFLTAVRTVAIDAQQRELKVVPVEHDDLDLLAEPALDDQPLDSDEVELVTLVREAFGRLPERDQRVLWHTTVEGAAPRVVGPLLGMSANAVSVRAMRAREALRARFLDARAEQELPGADTDECRWTVGMLGALVRGRLPRRQAERVQAHVEQCPHAAAVAAELHQLHDAFPALVVPLVLAAGLSTPGFVAAAGLGALTGAAALPDGSTSAASHAAPHDVFGELASRVAALGAAAAVAVGTLGVMGSPTSGPAPAASGTTTRGSAAATSASTTVPVAAAPSASPTTSTPSSTSTTTTSPTTTSATASPTVRALPAPTRPPPSSAPPQGNAVISAQLLGNAGPTSTFAVRVGSDAPGTLRLTVSNAAGAGRLTAENSAWSCRQGAAWSVRCVGSGGRVLLTQSGLGGLRAVVVTVVDASGATTTRTIRPS